MGSPCGNQSQSSSLAGNEKKLHSSTMHSPSRRSQPSPPPPFLNKFATTSSDKYAQNLRRDLLLSNFDRNLTVEQAHFDPSISLGVPQDYLSTTGTYGDNSTLSNQSVNSNIDNSNSNTGMNSDANTNINTILHRPIPDSTSVSTHSPPLAPVLTPPADSHYLSRRTSNSKLDTKRKQAKRSPMHSTATPSEYFHRNLVDAVSNVEDSDENEYFVYPYGGNEHHHNSSSSNNNNNNNNKNYNVSDYYTTSVPRSPLGTIHSHTSILRPSLSPHEIQDSTTPVKPHRPKLRSYVMDPHSTKKEYGSMKGSQTRFTEGQLSPNRHSSFKSYLPTYQLVTDGYASDNEGEPLVWYGGHRKLERRQWFSRLPLWAICGFVALFFLFCFMILLYGGAQPLQDVKVSMQHVLASDKELIFDLHVTAYNPNGWTVHVAEADMNVFALSQMAPLQSPMVNGTVSALDGTTSLSTDADPAEYLGSFYHFDEPLVFSSSIFSCKPSKAVSQIRIKSPGDDEGGNERWSRMIRYPYGLLARGILSYHSLGLPGVYSTVTICNVAKVDPITGVVSGDPNQGFCSLANQ